MLSVILLLQYSVNCYNRSLSSFPDIHFSIGNQIFTLSVLQYLLILKSNEYNEEYVCYTSFQNINLRDNHENFIWILGGYFLSRFYSIYDVERNRIGLAKSISYNYQQTPPQSLFNNSCKTIPFFSSIFFSFISILKN